MKLYKIIFIAAVVVLEGCSTINDYYEQNFNVAEGAPVVAAQDEPDQGDAHIVQPGETLYAIAWRYGRDHRELASANKVASPYKIYPGQRLSLISHKPYQIPKTEKTVEYTLSKVAEKAPEKPVVKIVEVATEKAPVKVEVTAEKAPAKMIEKAAEKAPEKIAEKTTEKSSVEKSKEKTAAKIATVSETKKAGEKAPDKSTVEKSRVPKIASEKITPEKALEEKSAKNDNKAWAWPVAGKVLKQFSLDKAKENKGVDIAGSLGTPVKAAKAGKVVYSGAGLRGYGNLLIIKHNETYLSAYAHNSRLLVKEGDSVQKGQIISEMGQSDTNEVHLHFEIRKNGQPINPVSVLPSA